MSSKEIAIIRRAREIISDPERWTANAYARDDEGQSTSPIHADAVCWCALGAIEKAASELKADWHRMPALHRLYDIAGGDVLSNINDKEGHAAVLSLFDKAIASEAA